MSKPYEVRRIFSAPDNGARIIGYGVYRKSDDSLMTSFTHPDTSSLAECKSFAQAALAEYNDWVPEPASQIDFTPTWRGVLPYLMLGLEQGNEEGKKLARLELAKMAEAADLWNASQKE